MKKITSLLLILVLISSCSGTKKQSVEDIIATNDLKTIQTKKDELVNYQQELVGQIKLLDDKIKALSPDRNVPLITTITAKPEAFNHYLEIQGNVETKQNLVLTPEAAGILTHVYVKAGDKVYKGQALAKIDDGGLSQQKAQLQIQTDLAKTTFERQKRLWEQNIGSEIQYLNAKSNFETSKEMVNQLNKQLAKTIVKAPFSGVIDEVITEQSNIVAPGQTPLMRIVNLSNMYIETDIPERYITTITKGKDVEVEFPVLGKTFSSKVRQTGSFINPANRTFKVEVAVPNKDKNIKPNLTARLKINDYSNPNAILIPQSIISENAKGEQYIYVLKDQNQDKATAQQTIITTGKTQGNNIEVLTGLKTDDTIIMEGARSVKDGQTVKIISS